MANLDDAARQALDDLLALGSDLEETEDRLDDLRQELVRTEERLDGDWSDLRQRLEGLLARADQRLHLVREGGASTEAAIDRLKDAAQPLAGEIQALLERAQGGLAEFGHWCEERNAELEAKAGELTAATEAAGREAQESEEQIAAVQAEAHDLLQRFSLELSSFHVQGGGATAAGDGPPTERYRAIREAYLERLQPRIEEQVHGLLEQIREAREKLEAGLEESAQLTEDALGQAEAELQDEHQHFLEELKQKVEAAREAILGFTQQVEQQGEGVDEERESTAVHGRDVHERLSGAEQTVSEVLELLSRFSFVRF